MAFSAYHRLASRLLREALRRGSTKVTPREEASEDQVRTTSVTRHAATSAARDNSRPPHELQISDRMTDSTGEWEVVGGRRAVRQHGLVQSVRGLDEGERQQMRAGHEPAERAGDIASRRHTPILNRTSHQFAVHRGQRFSAIRRYHARRISRAKRRCGVPSVASISHPYTLPCHSTSRIPRGRCSARRA